MVIEDDDDEGEEEIFLGGCFHSLILFEAALA
jgi:hypothetical protein